MNPDLNDRRYRHTDSWWNPRFTEAAVDKEFRRRFDTSAIANARIVLGILMFFWCGFVYFDLFLSPAAKFRVLEFRFTSVPPEVDAYFQSHLHHAATGQSAEYS